MAGDFCRGCHGVRLWSSQFIETSSVPSLCYQLWRIPLSHDIVPLFSLPKKACAVPRTPDFSLLWVAVDEEHLRDRQDCVKLSGPFNVA